MKYISTLITLLIINLTFGQSRKISSYNLGELYEQVKYTDYNSFKGNCGGYVNNVRFEYVIEMFDDSSKNRNTLKEQLNDNSFRNEYQNLIDKVIQNSKQISFYSEPNNNCPLKKFNYFKNILTYYEIGSKYYFELDNIESDRKNAKKKYYDDIKLQNDSIIQAKKLENKTKGTVLIAKSNDIKDKEGVNQKLKNYNESISSLNSKFENIKISYVNEKNAKIKKLTPTNFRVNKSKIENDYNSKIVLANSKNERDKNSLDTNYKNSVKDFDEKYKNTFQKLQNEYNELNNFDYNSLHQEKPNFDDSKFLEQQNNLTLKFESEKRIIFNNLTKIYNNEQNSGNRVNIIDNNNDKTSEPKKESTGKKALKVGVGILSGLLKK
jgi:hypothetical protein